MNSIPDSQSIRVALLGAGVIASPHIEALRTLGGAVEVVGVCDLDENKARSFQQEHGVGKAFSDLDAMLREVSPQVVHVLLPPGAHAAAAERCLSAGAHVFVEKPFCVSSAECLRVEAAARRAGRSIGVNHNLTYMPAVLKIIDSIRACKLGAVEQVRVMYNLAAPGIAKGPHQHWMFAETGNLILELGPHPISVICRLLGRVTGASTAVSGELRLTNGTRFFRTWQSSLVCERGAAQMVLAIGGGFDSSSVHVIGEDGEVFADLRRNIVRFSEKDKFLRTANLVDAWKSGSGVVRQGIGNFVAYSLGAVKLRPAYQMQNFSVNASVQAFYRALRSGRSPVIGGEQGTAVVEACEMVIDSALAFAGVEEAERVGSR
jgi:predicted dehydrogenase